MTDKVLKFGDLVIIHGAINPFIEADDDDDFVRQTKKVNSDTSKENLGNTGFLSAIGFTDSRVFIQAIPPNSTDALQIASNWSNYQDIVFQVWPKVNYEAHKQVKKLKKEKRLIEHADDETKSAFEERLDKMERRVENEKEANKRLLMQYMGQPIVYGTEVQLMHMTSESFLTAKVACSDSDKSAYKFDLSTEFSTGMVFKFLPRYQIRQEGEPVYMEDEILIYSVKLDCYMNFGNNQVIELDRENTQQSNHASITAAYELRSNNKGSYRYEAHISQFKDCTWKIYFYGEHRNPEVQSLRGGDLLRLKHSEQGFYIAANIRDSGLNKVYGSTYTGEYEEEQNNANSIWEVECEDTENRGQKLVGKDEKGKPKSIKLRHFLTGKLMIIEGETSIGVNRKVLSLAKGGIDPKKGTSLIFSAFASNPNDEILYNTAYALGVSDDKTNYKYITGYNPREDSQNERPTTTNNASNNRNFIVFKPLDESEFNVKKRNIFCDHISPRAEHAFILMKVEEEERANLFFVSSATHILRYFRDSVKVARDPSDISRDVLNNVLSTLVDLIIFVHKTNKEEEEEGRNDPVEFEGIVVDSKQRLLKDFKLIELLTEILYYPFEQNLFTLERINHVLYKAIFQYCYRLIKHIIKEYRPNEIYASQWLEHYMNQAMKSSAENDIKAEATLIELIDNNKKILDSKIDKDIISKFVDMLKDNKNDKFINLLRALCVCDGEAVTKNQTDMSRLIIEDKEARDSLIFQKFRSKRGLIEVLVPDYEPKGECWITIKEFEDKSKKEDGGDQFNYFLSMIYLLSDLCLERNYIAIDYLSEIYTYEICIEILLDNKIPNASRSAFAKLLNTLWIDKKPNTEISLPQYLVLWDDINATKCNEIASSHIEADKFEKLKIFLRNYFEELANDGCTKIYKKEINKFTSVLLELTTKLVKFGLYKSMQQLKELVRPLLILLNGMRDAMNKTEFEDFIKIKNGGKSRRHNVHTKEENSKNNKLELDERFREGDDTLIVMNCKNQICELVKFVMLIADDLSMRKFLFEFKKDLEFAQKEQDKLEISPFKDSSNVQLVPQYSTPSIRVQRVASEKKSIFNVFGSNEPQEIVVDLGVLAYNWLETITNENRLDLKSLAPTDFVRILFDLSMYEHSDLVNNSFNILYDIHSQRNRLKNMLEQVQILEDQDKLLAVSSIKEDIAALRDLAETTENWLGQDDAESVENLKQCIALMKKLGDYLCQDSFLYHKNSAEPDAELLDSKSRSKSDDEIVLDGGLRVNSEYQKIFKHLNLHEPLIDILEFELSTDDDTKTDKGKITLLREVIRLLTKFSQKEKQNQKLVKNELKVLFNVMKKYPTIGVEKLIEELFRGSKGLMRQPDMIEKFTKQILAIVSEMKPNDPKRAKMLFSLNGLMVHKKMAIKANQTIVLSMLTYRENIHLFITNFTERVKKAAIEVAFDDFKRKVQASDATNTIELPVEIDYVNALLELMAIACYGKNAVTESKSQSSWPLENLVEYYSNANGCWPAKQAALFFFYHVYLDTERENKEEKEHVKNLLRMMSNDIGQITRSFKSQYSIKYCKGTLDNKTTMEQFIFEAFVPSMSDMLVKDYIVGVDNKEALKTILENLLKIEQSIYNPHYKQSLKALFNKYQLHANDVYSDAFYGAWQGALPDSPILSKNASSMIKKNSVTTQENNAKNIKLKERLNLMCSKEEFKDSVENEFEGMINILLRVGKEIKGDIYSTKLSFNGVMKSLINLVDIKDPTLEKDLSLIGLKMFRKIIEKENKEEATITAAEWEGSGWADYKKNIVDKQNQLCKLGMVEIVGNILSFTNDIDLIHEAILLGIALLFGGNIRVQKAFKRYIQGDVQNKFLAGFKQVIDRNFETIKREMGLKNKHYAEALIAKDNAKAAKEDKKPKKPKKSPSQEDNLVKQGSDLLFSNGDGLEMEEEDDVEEIVIEPNVLEDEEETKLGLTVLQRAYRLLQLLCEGHNHYLQEILRVQTNESGVANGKTQDFITQTAYNFNILLKLINTDCVDVAVQMLDFLVESVQGPCKGNQAALGKAKIINSCFDFLTMFMKPIDYQKRGFLTPEQVAEADDGTTTAMKVLSSLIEGNNDPEITEEMASLDLKFLVTKLSQEYATFVKTVMRKDPEKTKPEDVNEDLDAGSLTPQILETFDIYILLITLSESNAKVAALLKNKDEFGQLGMNALSFFHLNTASVEIIFNEQLLKIYFPIHTVCKYLTKNSRDNLMNTVVRDSPNEKIGGLINAAPELFDEMNHMAWLKSQIFEFSQFRYNLLRDISTFLALFINLVIVCTYTLSVLTDDTSIVIVNMGTMDTSSFINALGYIQIGTSSLMIVFWIIINTPMILRRRWRASLQNHKDESTEGNDEEIDIELLPLDQVLTLLFKKGPYDPIFNPNGKRRYGHLFVALATWWRNVAFILSEGSFVFMCFYFCVSCLGIALSEITYCLHLLDIINRSDILRNVIRSVTHNVTQLLSTAMLGIIFIYIYTVVGFFFLDTSYYNGDMGDNGERSCTSMIQCFMTTLNYGLRNGGGIGESLTFISYESHNRGKYIFRLIFDLTFFIIINIIFLNIIFGIIIDTFAELRDRKREMDEDMKTVCYICNLDRYTFDKNGGGFEKHIKNNHHLWNYLYFIYSLNVKDSTEYNGIESYISKKLDEEDISWFPLHKAIELEGENVE